MKKVINKTLWFKTIESRDVEAIEELIKSGVNINYQDRNGETALHMAYKTVLKFLLENNFNFNLNQPNKKGKTPLHVASINQYLYKMLLLINYGADINCKDNFGETPLHYFFNTQYPDINFIKPLIENGANINLQNIKGQGVIHFCARFCPTDVLNLLIENDVNINMQDDNGNTALHIAISSNGSITENFTEIKNLLINGAEINIKNKDGDTPLDLALIDKKDDIVNIINFVQKERNFQEISKSTDNNNFKTIKKIKL